MRISRDCFANFVSDFRTTFVRMSHECRENFHASRTSRELVAKVLNMFKNFMRIFSTKYFARLSRECRATVARVSRDGRATFVRVSRDGRATFVRVSRTCRRKYLAKLQCKIFATFVRMSCECRTTVRDNMRKPRDYLARK